MHEPAVHHVRIGDVRVPYLELGMRQGPPVVLLPGLSDGLAPVTRSETRRLYAQAPLPLEQVRGIVISHRAPVHAPVTTRQLAADTAAVLERLLDGPAVLVGHSMGGMVAQHLAADHPALVSSLVLTASSARADDGLRAVLARWDALIVAHRFEAFARDAVRCSFTDRELLARQHLLERSPPPPPPLELVTRHLALSRACATHDARARLAAVTHPALVLAGERDAVVAASRSAVLAAALPLARFEQLPGLGHGFPEQDPGRYRSHVIPFLAEAGLG